jgi:hypothetical protein
LPFGIAGSSGDDRHQNGVYDELRKAQGIIGADSFSLTGMSASGGIP